MAAPTHEDLKKLEKEIKDLKISRKLPAKPPGIFKKTDGNFSSFAEILVNYFQVMCVPTDERPKLLLTYLSPEDYEAVTQIYPSQKLGNEKWEVVVEKVSKILSENITRPVACAKLMKLKQGKMTMSDFIKKLEHYGTLAFPEAKMKDAKLRVMTSSLQANCRSKILAYETHNFIQEKSTETTEPDFSEISLKAIELDQILGDKEDYSDGELESKMPTASVFNIKNKPTTSSKKVETRSCYNCGIKGHLKATCWRKSNSNQRSSTRNNARTNNFQKKYNNNDRNYQSRRPSYSPGTNGGKVHLLDTTDLQSLDLNSNSLQPEKELLL